MRYLFWSVPSCLLSLGMVVPGAFANQLVTNTPLKQQALSPISSASPSLLSSWQLSQLATRMAQHVEGKAVSTAPDSLDLPGLEHIIDHRGNVRLPLGLTIYTTLGDTSVGFGTNF